MTSFRPAATTRSVADPRFRRRGGGPLERAPHPGPKAVGEGSPLDDDHLMYPGASRTAIKPHLDPAIVPQLERQPLAEIGILPRHDEEALRTVRAHLMRLAVTAGLLLTLAGCAASGGSVGRAATGSEAGLVARAIVPLLHELGYAVSSGLEDCRIALIVVQTSAINASTGAGTARPCTLFALALTDGALRRLPVDMLRAILAHELGHIHLGHLEARRERRGETPAALRPFTRGFDRREEAAADAFAVELLRRLEPEHRNACVALVYVFALLAEQGEGLGRWFATHPSPDGRAETALAGCNR